MCAAAAADARGLKRVCVSCGIRFYDFNKRPIECPNCDTEYTGEIKVKGRRGKAAIVADLEKEAAPKKGRGRAANPDNTEEVEQEDGVVSLEDLVEDSDDDIDDEDLTVIEDLDDLDDDALEEVEVVDDKDE